MSGSGRKNKQVWFEENVVAEPCGYLVPDCDACVFHETPLCNKMVCVYPATMDAFYWRSKDVHVNIATWHEAINWFSATPVTTVIDIAKGVMKKSILEKKR